MASPFCVEKYTFLNIRLKCSDTYSNAKSSRLNHKTFKNMITTILIQALDFFSDALNVWSFLQVLWEMCKAASKLLSKHKDKR